MQFQEKLLKERAICLGMPINDEEATGVIAKLLFLESDSKKLPIKLYINSPGGSATAGLAIVETIESMKAPVHTCCIGHASGLAAIILATGFRGGRSATQDAIISFNEIRIGASMSVPSPEQDFHLKQLRNKLIEKACRSTGMKTADVDALFSSERELSPHTAAALGITDQVIEG
jgi:ATP-dependent Clp protease, protease subunit